MSGERFEAEHREAAEALGAYALSALAEPETAHVEAHLRECERCRADLDALRVAVATLPAAATPVAAPPGLHDRVMSTVRAEAELLRAAGSQADRPPVPSRPARGRLGGLLPRPALVGVGAAAMAAAAVAGFLAGGGALGGAGHSGTVTARMLTDAGVAATTRAVLRRDGDRGTLEVRDMPAPPGQRVYELWVQRAGEPPVPAGATFVLRSGTVRIPHSLDGVQRVLVTAEPPGGSRTPTRAPILVARAS